MNEIPDELLKGVVIEVARFWAVDLLIDTIVFSSSSLLIFALVNLTRIPLCIRSTGCLSSCLCTILEVHIPELHLNVFEAFSLKKI